MADRFKVYRFKQIDSTNSAAFRYARRGAPSGTVFVAEYQTKGRGKWGRRWVSPRGKNLLFSLLLHPTVKAAVAPLATQMACRSVAHVLRRELKLEPAFKRPNDVLVGGKKICGVLVESQGRADGRLESLVVGVGLNVNASPDELVPGATSLLQETGRKRSLAVLLRALVKELRKDLQCFSV